MTRTFRDKWLDAVNRKDSVLCAGLDPAEYDMGRGKEGLPLGRSKFDWARRYLLAVAPYCAAIKPNTNYWEAEGDMASLETLNILAAECGMVLIEDSKRRDIGPTNDAGLFHAQKKRFDAVTFSPFAGNLEEATKQAHKRGLGLISMCLMSNPEFEREKNALVEVDDNGSYNPSDIGKVGGVWVARRFIQLAHDAHEYGTDGIVIGAPSEKNHITRSEIRRIRSQVGNEMLVLLPGVGAQGGEAEEIWKHFDKDNVIVNVGRSLMLPNGSNSTPEEQAAAAKHYKDKLNELRKAT